MTIFIFCNAKFIFLLSNVFLNTLTEITLMTRSMAYINKDARPVQFIPLFFHYLFMAVTLLFGWRILSQYDYI